MGNGLSAVIGVRIKPGLIVTTANITDKNFMDGNMKFDMPGKANARIDNAGHITVSEAGLAALVAPQVSNSGVISAKLGQRAFFAPLQLQLRP